MIVGCLSNDTRLEYWIQFPFGHEIMSFKASDPSVKLPLDSEFQVTGLKVNITPVLPDLLLFGTPRSFSLIEGKLFVCMCVYVYAHRRAGFLR